MSVVSTRRTGRALQAFGLFVVVAAISLATASRGEGAAVRGARSSAADPVGIHKIQHVVVIMQENRSFDTYFGTYPGADGIPMDANGQPTVCVPDPYTKGCDRPYLSTVDKDAEGPPGQAGARTDIDGGLMDGFVRSAAANGNPANAYKVMRYYDASSTIPNYWAYAHNFVLNDHMIEPNLSWSSPEHLYLVSGWSARCRQPGVAASCSNDINTPNVARRTKAASASSKRAA